MIVILFRRPVYVFTLLSFLLSTQFSGTYLLLFKSKDDTFMVKKSCNDHNFYVLIYKKECFLANLEGVKFENFSRPLGPTIVEAPYIISASIEERRLI